jgi:hypothetical protein
LAGCVERYCPLGFQATFSFLEHRAGQFRRDEAALLGALDELSTSRALWKEDLVAYAAQRCEAKRLGRRRPHPGEPNRNWATHWYGDRRGAALHAIWFTLRSRRGQGAARVVSPEVIIVAAACLDNGGNLDQAVRLRVRDLRASFEQERHTAGWPNVNWPMFTRARDSLRLLLFVEHALPQDATPHGQAVA